MAKEQIPFEDFMAAVPPDKAPIVAELDALMREGGCAVEIKPAKSGYVTSYRHTGTRKVMANFVFRKKGPLIRIYAENVMRYMELLEAMPPALKSRVAKAPLCKRLVNPELCSPHCPKGYEFILEGETHQKCRYNCFLIPLEDEAIPSVRALVRQELACRNA